MLYIPIYYFFFSNKTICVVGFLFSSRTRIFLIQTVYFKMIFRQLSKNQKKKKNIILFPSSLKSKTGFVFLNWKFYYDIVLKRPRI